MARLVTKFKFLKSGDRKGAGGYAKYIATREGVERIDDSQRLAPATKQQETLIEKILKDFPDSATLMEYADYQSEPNMGNASEFIFRAIEDNADDLLSSKTYADYIATRPRAQRFGSHGLFTDDGVRVQLEKVSEELNLHEGNVWTAIISLRREDAERLGFNSGERWRDMLRAHTHELSDAFHIPMTDLKCISRLDYGKKYCTESITVDEQALQRAIVRALNRFNVEDEATYLLLMKSTIGEAVGINGSSDEIDLLERRIDALNKRMLDLVSLSVQEGDDAENHEDDFKNISTQIEQLTKRITAIRESESENGDFQARLKEIQDIIDKRRENKDIYDDSIVRQMVECIKVYHDGRLQIILGGGYELEEYLEK